MTRLEGMGIWVSGDGEGREHHATGKICCFGEIVPGSNASSATSQLCNFL